MAVSYMAEFSEVSKVFYLLINLSLFDVSIGGDERDRDGHLEFRPKRPKLPQIFPNLQNPVRFSLGNFFPNSVRLINPDLS